MKEFFESFVNDDKCPKCGSEDIMCYEDNGDEEWVNRFFNCGRCDLDFIVCYKFTHIEWFEGEDEEEEENE